MDKKRNEPNSKNRKSKPILKQMIYKIKRIQQPKLFKSLHYRMIVLSFSEQSEKNHH